MHLWVGLGNPGKAYAYHRHNFGFMVVDVLHETFGFSSFRQKFHGLVAEGILGEEKILLLKPETYMNLSGKAMAAAMQFYKIPLEKVLVIHDDIDLAFGKIRLKTGGGHGGHNGLRDIDRCISKNYGRLRLGIGHPGDKNRVSDYVLSNFTASEQEEVDQIIDVIKDNAALLTDPDQWSQFLNICHQQRVHDTN